MGRVMANFAAIDPHAANLLSGGVDSSYIQAHWNTANRIDGSRILRSVAIHVNIRKPTENGITRFRRQGISGRRRRVLGKRAVRSLSARRRLPRPASRLITSSRPISGHWHGSWFGGESAPGFAARGPTACSARSTASCSYRAAELRRWLPFRGLQLGARGLPMHWAGHDGPLPAARRAHDRPSRPQPSGQRDCGLHGVARRGRVFRYRRHRPCNGLSAKIAGTVRHSAGTAGQRPRSRVLGRGDGHGVALDRVFRPRRGAGFVPFMDSRVLRVAVNIEPQYRFSACESKRVLKRALSRHARRGRLSIGRSGDSANRFRWLCARRTIASAGRCDWPLRFRQAGSAGAGQGTAELVPYSLLCYDLWYKVVYREIAVRAGVIPAHDD